MAGFVLECMAGFVGIRSTIVVALINRQPPMAILIDSRIRTLIEGYDKHINDLQEEIQKLEAKVNALTAELEQCALNCERRLLPRRGLSD